MPEVETGLRVRQVLVGIYDYQYQILEDLCEAQRTTRSALIRSAIDLLIQQQEDK